MLRFLADRTATQYDRLLTSSYRPSFCPSVCNAVHCGSHDRCTGLKGCTSVFLAGKLIFVPSDTIAVLYRLATKRTKKTNGRKR